MPMGRGRPCFLGSTGLGRCHLGNIAVQLRDSAVHPRGNVCLPEGITCLGIAGLRGTKTCMAPDCLGKDHTLCLRRSAVHRGRLGTAGLGDLTLRLSVIHQGSLGTACLGYVTLCQWGCYIPGKPGNCLPGRSHSLLGKKVFSAREAWELPAWEMLLSAWERVLPPREDQVLPAWEISLSAGERVLSAGEAWELPAREILLSAWERALSLKEDWELPAWGVWGLPAWEIALRGRTLSTWEAWGEALGINPPAWELLAAYKALVAGVACPGEGPSSQENLRALPSYTICPGISRDPSLLGLITLLLTIM